MNRPAKGTLSSAVNRGLAQDSSCHRHIAAFIPDESSIYIHARTMRAHAAFPHDLGRETIEAAVYFFNRTPRRTHLKA